VRAENLVRVTPAFESPLETIEDQVEPQLEVLHAAGSADLGLEALSDEYVVQRVPVQADRQLHPTVPTMGG